MSILREGYLMRHLLHYGLALALSLSVAACGKTDKSQEQLLVGVDEGVRGERTHAGAGSRRHPAQGARPQQSKAVVVHGRVGAGIKGVQPPSCVQRVRGPCAAAHGHQLCLPGLLECSTG